MNCGCMLDKDGVRLYCHEHITLWGLIGFVLGLIAALFFK